MPDLLLCAPPPEQDCGWSELPDVIPDWVLEAGPLPEPLPCDCGCSTAHDVAGHEVAVHEVVGADAPVWATPGVTGLAATPVLPAVSDVVAAAQASVQRLASVDPSTLGCAQALADGEALLGLEQQLRVLNLRRVADVAARGLHELVGYRSAKAWLRTHRPDGDAADATLASQLRDFPQVREAVEAGRVPLAGARKVVRALRKVAPHVDRRDGLIDGQPGEQLLEAVVRHVVTLVCRDLQGLHDDDPRVRALLGRARALLEQGGSQAARLEAAFTWLAEELAPRSLAGALDELVMAILPSALEDRGDRGHRRCGVDLRPLPDGTGWHVCGDLDLECGERLWVAMRAEAARDPQNPTDTQAWEQQRKAGTDDDVWGLGLGALPRSRRERMHDALSRLLERYLDAGLGGRSGKAPVQIHVTLTEQTVTGQTGALPARADSGRLIPRNLIRRWWCDSSVTAYVLSLGGKALRVVHGQRTLTAEERRALAVEGGGRCAGQGCCPSTPDPLLVLRPHHTRGFAEDQVTTIEETIAVCDTLHHDLHEGKRTVRLRDGRYLNEHGFVDQPSLTNPPPF